MESKVKSRLSSQNEAPSQRLGFMKSQIIVPDDFDQMEKEEISHFTDFPALVSSIRARSKSNQEKS